MEFEACIESLEGALLAERYGADRVELCSALNEGGLTPSNGLLKQIKENSNLPVFAMIRPIAGGFIYTDEVVDLMCMEIAEMAKGGADGVVFGVLDQQSNLDLKANARLINEALKHHMTPICHRAFDFTPEPFTALDKIIDLGFKRLLTSGQKPKAIEGLDLIKALHQKAAGRIEIMAGSGVSQASMEDFSKSGIDAVHFTVGAFEENVPLGMGARLISNEQKVKAIMQYKQA